MRAAPEWAVLLLLASVPVLALQRGPGGSPVGTPPYSPEYPLESAFDGDPSTSYLSSPAEEVFSQPSKGEVGPFGSLTNSSFPLANAFDGEPSSPLRSELPVVVGFNFGGPMLVQAYSIYCTEARCPRDFLLEGFESGAWKTIDNRTGQTKDVWEAEVLRFSVEPSRFSMYRLVISGSNADSADTVELPLGELQFHSEPLVLLNDTNVPVVPIGTDAFEEFAPGHAFDEDRMTWYITNQAKPNHAELGCDFGKLMWIDSYAITAGHNFLSRAPNEFELYGFADGTWTRLDRRDGQTVEKWYNSPGLERHFDIETPGLFYRYKVVVTENNDYDDEILSIAIAELRFYRLSLAPVVPPVAPSHWTQQFGPFGTTPRTPDFPVGNVFDGSVGTLHVSAMLQDRVEIGFNYLRPFRVSGYSIVRSTGAVNSYGLTVKNSPAMSPKYFELHGYDRYAGMWEILDRRINQTAETWSKSSQVMHFLLEAPSEHTAYKLVVKGDNDIREGVSISIAEISFYSAPVTAEPEIEAPASSPHISSTSFGPFGTPSLDNHTLGNAFDDIMSTAYISVPLPRFTSPEIGYIFSQPTVVSAYTIVAIRDLEAWAPRDFELQGQIDGEWSTLDRRTHQTVDKWFDSDNAEVGKQTFYIATPGGYSLYLLVIQNDNNGGPEVVAAIGELQFSTEAISIFSEEGPPEDSDETLGPFGTPGKPQHPVSNAFDEDFYTTYESFSEPSEVGYIYEELTVVYGIAVVPSANAALGDIELLGKSEDDWTPLAVQCETELQGRKCIVKTPGAYLMYKLVKARGPLAIGELIFVTTDIRSRLQKTTDAPRGVLIPVPAPRLGATQGPRGPYAEPTSVPLADSIPSDPGPFGTNHRLHYALQNAFDGDIGTQYISVSTTPVLMGFNFGTPTVIYSYEIIVSSDHVWVHYPRDFVLQGYAGGAWVVLDRRVGQVNVWHAELRLRFEIAMPGPYSAYRLEVGKDNNDRQGVYAVAVAELVFHRQPPPSPVPERDDVTRAEVIWTVRLVFRSDSSSVPEADVVQQRVSALLQDAVVLVLSSECNWCVLGESQFLLAVQTELTEAEVERRVWSGLQMPGTVLKRVVMETGLATAAPFPLQPHLSESSPRSPPTALVAVISAVGAAAVVGGVCTVYRRSKNRPTSPSTFPDLESTVPAQT